MVNSKRTILTAPALLMLLLAQLHCGDDSSPGDADVSKTDASGPLVDGVTPAPDMGQHQVGMVDENATEATVKLFQNLRQLAQTKLLLGHTDTNMMGINADGTGWFYEKDRSDVKEIVGDYPAIYGFDIVNLLKKSPQTADDLKYMIPRMREAFARGGIITVCWHAYNPISGGDFFNGSPVKDLLPGGSRHELFKKQLDKLAEFIGNLEDAKGQSIPIIFRPWHEQNGGQFWWGEGRCTVEEYKRFYQFTVTYLRDVKAVHNFLYAYSPVDWFEDMDNYLERYPGDAYIDVFGLDTYGNHEAWYKKRLLFYMQQMVKLAEEKNKIAAITEIGYKNGEEQPGLKYCPNPNWLVETILETVKGDSTARKLAYIVFWRNEAYTPTNYYLPHPGAPQAQDLLNFYKDPYTAFEKDLPPMYQ